MKNLWFEFKRFRVEQAGAAMKVGTDGTLLGAWARVEPWQKRLLDVGTGTGLIALMIAQRSEDWDAVVDAVEVDEGSFRQAAENFAASPWSGRLNAVHAALGDYARRLQGFDGHGAPDDCARRIHDIVENDITKPGGGIYDHIISNPPYFTDSLKAPDGRRAAARHADSLPYGELASRSAALLTQGGLLSVIIPFDSEARFRREANRCGLYVSRRTVVRSLPEAVPKRVMLEFSRTQADGAVESELLIETSPGGNYSEEYRRLTKDFYLKF